MKKILFITFLISTITYFPKFLYAQCTLTNNDDTQAEVLTCLSNCICDEIIIPDGVTLNVSGDWDLVAQGPITITIAMGGSLNFGGTDKIILASGSSLAIDDTGDTGALTSSGGEPEDVRFIIGTAEFSSNAFPDIIAAGGIDENSTLPIELLSFSGKHVDAAIQLHWRTASEQDNDFMEIQRSKDGKTFDSIGVRQGAGNSYTPRDYSFTDEQPLPGVNYYRLRQVDFDGKFEYHPVIAVLFRTDEDKAQGITLFPTVASDRLNLALSTEATADGDILISNLQGRVLLRTPFGRGMQQLSLPVNQLPQGSYILTVQTGRTKQVARFIKE